MSDLDGTFNLSGLRCSHVSTQGRHPGIITGSSRRHQCEHRENQLVQISQNHRASRRVQAHQAGMGRRRHNRSLQQSAHDVFFSGRPGE